MSAEFGIFALAAIEREKQRADRAEEQLRELREALRTARSWMCRPSDVEAQHAKTLIRASHEIDALLSRTEGDG